MCIIFDKLIQFCQLNKTLNQELIYKVGLTLIPSVGPVIAKKLIAYCNGVEAVFRESRQNLMKIPGVGRQTADAIVNQKVLSAAEFEISFMQQNGVKALFYQDESYPFRLKHCADSPILLYSKGDVDYNKSKIISIVGTRMATEYGISWCQEFIRELKGHDVIVVSGLAYGIDICAHKACLDYGIDTVAVLGHGLDRIYPTVHSKMAQQIAESGALLTEFETGIEPVRENFPKRNRIVAGIADATIVVEARRRGGALITAGLANSYNRDVFALPGNIQAKSSMGCNFLIKTNQAHLIESVKDLEYIMSWDTENIKDDTVQTELFISLTKEEEEILGALATKDKLAIDVLSLMVQQPVSKLVQGLLQLELKGLVKSLPGKVYKRT